MTIEPDPPPRGDGSGSLSLAFLIGMNLVPLGFLLFADWSPGDVLIAYWLENVVVGLFTVVKIVTARAGGEDATRAATKIGLAAFFTFHFGIFTLVHGVFTLLLAYWIGVSGSLDQWVLVGVGLVLSHGISLAVFWLHGRERERTAPRQAMAAPYSRIMVLHFVVLASAFLMTWLVTDGGFVPDDDGRLLPAILLIVIKTATDVVAHLRAHRQAPIDAATAGRAPGARAG